MCTEGSGVTWLRPCSRLGLNHNKGIFKVTVLQLVECVWYMCEGGSRGREGERDYVTAN